jgi:hypothetical protein
MFFRGEEIVLSPRGYPAFEFLKEEELRKTPRPVVIKISEEGFSSFFR